MGGLVVAVVVLDTAGPVVGVGLWTGEAALVRTARVVRGSEGLLMPWVLELLAEAGLTMADVRGVGVAAGPGAFTGLRVGLASAAGLAMAVGCPLWTSSSLTTRALRAGGNMPVLAMLDARKAKVYAQLHHGDQGVVAGPGDVPPEEAVAWAASRGAFVATGEGALVYRNLVEQAGGVIAREPDDPAVDTLARCAALGLARGEGQSPAAVRPVYLRPPDAKPSNKGRIRGS